MNHIKGMECISCRNPVAYNTKKMQYTCPKCGGNLDVIFDYEKIKKHFNKKSIEKNKNFSIWRYSSLLPISDLSYIPPLHIGWTPLYHAKSLGDHCGIENLYLKDDGRNPSASLKDRASAIALVCALERGIKNITGASTGNAGSSMACLCASMGLSPVIFVPEKAPRAKIAQLLLYGAKVLMVKGTYDEAFELCLNVSQKYGWFNRNTGYNPFTREGKKTCILEVCEQLQWEAPDWVFISVGDGNIISGLWKGLRDLYHTGFIEKLPKICAVQSTLSNSIVKSLKKSTLDKIVIEPVQATTIADSISVDLPRDGIAAVRAILESKGTAVEVTDEDILSTIRLIANYTGIFGEPAGVTSVAGLLKQIKKKAISSNEKVVCIITGSGLKDIDSALKVAGSGQIIEPTIEAVDAAFKQR